MASINHDCRVCGEVWSDNELYSTCTNCFNENKGSWDEEKTQYIREEYSIGEEDE